ncbi:MAG: ABC transporter permease [bacterium]
MINMNRIKAIFVKELQDVKTNTSVIYMFFLPVVLTILWDRFMSDMPDGFALTMGILFLVVMVGMYVPAMIVSEEKEKNTIGVLILSPATPTEVFLGKGLFTFLSVIVISLGLIFTTGTSVAYMPIIMLSTLLTSITCIFLGMIVGLLSKDQKATGIIGTPIYLLLLVFPIYGNMGVEFMASISRALPTYYYFNIIRLALDEGKNIVELSFEFIILLVFIVISFAVLSFVYKRKGVS